MGLAPVAAIAVLLAAGQTTVTVDARAVRPGELVALRITTPAPVDRLRVEALGRAAGVFSTGPRTWTALVGIDLDAAPGRYPVTIDPGTGVPPTTYELDVKPRQRERIERERQLLEAVWAAGASERLWTAPFVRPVPHPANSRFGTRSTFNGIPLNPHGGADFLSPPGAPVRAPNAGRVVVARALYFSGGTVVIDHGAGLFSTLAHLSAIDVAEGDGVEAGQIVGRVGATGRVTGPHLHWAVRASGARVDPLGVLVVLGRRDAPGQRRNGR
jgi:murein DD-endopeptidase MepM/ murein hydrolase activator NlpD